MGCLCLAESEVGAITVASAQPKSHMASCPFSPHSWAHSCLQIGGSREEKKIHIDWEFVCLATCWGLKCIL